MGPRTCSGTRLCAASGGGSSVVRDHAGTKGSQAWPLFARMTHTNQEVHPSSIRSSMLRRKVCTVYSSFRCSVSSYDLGCLCLKEVCSDPHKATIKPQARLVRLKVKLKTAA